MKYYLQRQASYNRRRRWIGVEQFEEDSDLEALEYFLSHCRRVERLSPTPNVIPYRIIDGTDSVIATFTPNPAKL